MSERIINVSETTRAITVDGFDVTVNRVTGSIAGDHTHNQAASDTIADTDLVLGTTTTGALKRWTWAVLRSILDTLYATTSAITDAIAAHAAAASAHHTRYTDTEAAAAAADDTSTALADWLATDITPVLSPGKTYTVTIADTPASVQPTISAEGKCAIYLSNPGGYTIPEPVGGYMRTTAGLDDLSEAFVELQITRIGGNYIYSAVSLEAV